MTNEQPVWSQTNAASKHSYKPVTIML